MRCSRTGPSGFTVEFENADEVLQEYRTNLSMGGLRLETAERIALHSSVTVTLRGPFGAVETLQATVVAPLPGGVALSVGAQAKGLPDRLLARTVQKSVDVEAVPKDAGGEESGECEEALDAEMLADAEEASDAEELADDSGAATGTGPQTMWDRIRGMARTKKILLAAKAERTERALLLQDNDPQVLFSLLKNPRLTADEVVRIAKSPYLTFQTAELLMKSTVWFANVDVRVALVHNPKLPTPFALRILPTLPEAEVKAIARGAATSMALKTAALRRLQTGT